MVNASSRPCVGCDTVRFTADKHAHMRLDV
jgi:hypothetical protein